MFNPLSTIMVAILAYFIFGENLYVGRYAGNAWRSVAPGVQCSCVFLRLNFRCSVLMCSIIGGVVVILGLYLLLWGKEKDQEHGASKKQELELDCEKQQQARKVSDVYAAQQSGSEAPRTMK